MHTKVSLSHHIEHLLNFTKRANAVLWFLTPLTTMQLVAAAPASQNLNTLKFSEVVDKVMIIDSATQRSRQAKVDEVFKVPDQVSTGANSRAELVAADGTVTRVGANTVFSFAADKREIQLKQGSVLFHSPTGKGGGVISTEGAQAAVMGTTLIVTATPSGGFKLLVMEGKAKATLPGGSSISVTAGQLTLVTPGRRDFGPVLNFRLKDQVGGSNLMKGFSAPIASEQKVMDSMNRQERMISTGRAEPTNFRARGEQLVEGNQPPPPPSRDPRTEAVSFKGVLNPTEAQLSLAANSNVIVDRLGNAPTANLLYWPKGNLSDSLGSILGPTALTAARTLSSGKMTQMLLADILTIGGATAEPLPEGGNVSQYLFPIQNGQTTSPWQVKFVAAKGALTIDDYQPSPVPEPGPGMLVPERLAASENLLWLSSKTSVNIISTMFKARSDLLQIGVLDSSIPANVTILNSVIFNQSGPVSIFGYDLGSTSASMMSAGIYARGDITLQALHDINVNNSSTTTTKVFHSLSTDPSAAIRLTAANELNFFGRSFDNLASTLSAQTIAIDARTVNLTDLNITAPTRVTINARTINLVGVNFNSPSVTLNSGLGGFATTPGPNHGKVYLNNVKFNGAPVIISTPPSGFTVSPTGNSRL